MDKHLESIDANQSVFEEIKRTDKEGNEYWSSRDLGKILGYQDYRNFVQVIEKGKTSP